VSAESGQGIGGLAKEKTHRLGLQSGLEAAGWGRGVVEEWWGRFDWQLYQHHGEWAAAIAAVAGMD
jgi:hypothetical protein